MKILVIKFNRHIIDAIAGLPVVAVCDPDLNGRALAQHELPDAKLYTDTSLAIRESGCDTVLLTISDNAAPLALLALSYGKDVFLAKGVGLGRGEDRIRMIAAQSGRMVSL